MRASRLALVPTLVLAVIGCGDAPSPPALPAEKSIVDVAGEQAPIVRVLDAGRAPRRALEQAPISGEREVELALDMSALGQPTSPPMKLRVTLLWSTSAAADVPWRFAVQRAEMKMATASGSEQSIVDTMATMYGQIAGHARRRGPAQLEIAQTEGMISRPAVPWLLHLFAFAPPTEPLGVGATWTTASTSEVEGETCSESRRYEVTAIDAHEITAVLTAQMHCGAAPAAEAPAMHYAMHGELHFAPADSLAIAGDLTSTLTTTFPALTNDADAPRELEASLRIALVTTSK